MPVREELNRIDIRLVSSKGLDGLASTDIPQLGKGIAGTRDEGVLVGRVEADAHDISEVIGELDNLAASLNVPLHAGHVTRRGENTPVVDEAAARQVACVAGELAGNPGGAVPVLIEVVDGADVIETTAGNVIAAGRVGARHDPGRAQGDGVDLIGGVSVPDDELAILRSRNQMPSVGRPVHSINLGEMALERPLGLHQLVLGDRLVCLLGDGSDCGSC